MDVILRSDVHHLGKAGEVVKVKDGYARNYLIPRGLALLATDGSKRQVAAQARRAASSVAAEQTAAEALAARLAGAEVHFTAKAGEADKLFGSVTAADIAAKLAEQGFPIDKRSIELDEPLRMIGAHKVPIRLHPSVHAEIRVWVVKE